MTTIDGTRQGQGRLAAALWALLAGILAVAPESVQAAQRGPLAIHVEAVFGAPVASSAELSLLPLTGTAVYAGVSEGELDISALAFIEQKGSTFNAEDALGASAISDTDGDGVPEIVDGWRCSDARCVIVGTLFGRAGRLTVATLEPREGGRFVFDMIFASVFCPRCPER